MATNFYTGLWKKKVKDFQVLSGSITTEKLKDALIDAKETGATELNLTIWVNQKKTTEKHPDYNLQISAKDPNYSKKQNEDVPF
jgi:hypothetical protein